MEERLSPALTGFDEPNGAEPAIAGRDEAIAAEADEYAAQFATIANPVFTATSLDAGLGESYARIFPAAGRSREPGETDEAWLGEQVGEYVSGNAVYPITRGHIRGVVEHQVLQFTIHGQAATTDEELSRALYDAVMRGQSVGVSMGGRLQDREDLRTWNYDRIGTVDIFAGGRHLGSARDFHWTAPTHQPTFEDYHHVVVPDEVRSEFRGMVVQRPIETDVFHDGPGEPVNRAQRRAADRGKPWWPTK